LSPAPVTVLLLPLFILLAFSASFGVGLWIAALMVKYRDFRFIVPFVVQFGLYISPVGFSSNVVPAKWRFIFSFNPVVGVIDGFRWSLLHGQPLVWWPNLANSILMTSFLFLSGIWYFRKMERNFADVI
jgi:lipopolysaccharide transport system permease protein